VNLSNARTAHKPQIAAISCPMYEQLSPRPGREKSTIYSSVDAGIYVEPDVDPPLGTTRGFPLSGGNERAAPYDPDTARYYLSPVSGKRPNGKLNTPAIKGGQLCFPPSLPDQRIENSYVRIFNYYRFVFTCFHLFMVIVF